MFCCQSNAVLTQANLIQPSYQGDYEILWLGSKKPDLSILARKESVPAIASVDLTQCRIYHVSSLKEFEKASLGLFFKTKLGWFRSMQFTPRRFHAVVIADWTDKPQAAERTLATINKVYTDLSWTPAPYIAKEPAYLSIKTGVRNSLTPIDSLSPTPKDPINPDSIRRNTRKAYVSPIDTGTRTSNPSTPGPILLTSSTATSTTASIMPIFQAPRTIFVSPKTQKVLSTIETPHAPLSHSFDLMERELRNLSTLAIGPAEKASVELHQNALLEAFSMECLQRRGMSHVAAYNFRKAILYSDMGKITCYKKWLTEHSEDSAKLLTSLRLQDDGPLTKILSELTGGKPFINPDFSNEEIYEIFKAIPILVAYFHEFQGMRVAEAELLKGSITPSSFREIIMGFYGHNGPGDPSFEVEGESPFWSGIPKIGRFCLNKLVSESKLPQKALTFFEGTSFIQADGQFKYHDPQTALGYEHMILDRFDGYRNSIKIRNEIPFLSPIEAEIETFFGPNYNTRLALIYDETILLPRMLAKGSVNQSEFERLTKATRELKTRVEFIHAELVKRIPKAEELSSQLKRRTTISQIEIHIPQDITLHVPTDAETTLSYTFSKEDIGAWFSESALAFREFMDNNVRYPIIKLDLERFGTYNDFWTD